MIRIALGVAMLGRTVCHGAAPYEPAVADPLLEPWRWRTFPELSGLGAQCMVEGTDGVLWFGAVSAIWRFDGLDWNGEATVQVVGGAADALCAGPNGSILAGGRWGISQWADGEWKRMFPLSGGQLADVRKLRFARDGALWAATSRGALHFDGTTWTLFTDAENEAQLSGRTMRPALAIRLLPDPVLTTHRSDGRPANRTDLAEICEDSQGRIWIGTTAGEILRFTPEPASPSAVMPAAARDGTWSIYNETDGLVRGRQPSILPLRDGPVWVVYGTGSGHANVFDGSTWRTIRLEDFGVPGDCGHPIQTNDGAIWLSGRYVISVLRGQRWQSYSKPEVPIPTARNFLHQSRDGALWIAGPDTEIHRVDYQTSRWLTLEDLNFQGESRDGTSWFLHRSGRVVAQKGDAWTSYGTEDGTISTPVAVQCTRAGDVWVAGSHESTAATARFDGRAWTRHVHSDFSWGVEWRGVLEASDGSVWFSAAVDTSGPAAHRAGILQFRDGRWIHHHQPGRSSLAGGDSDPATLLPATQRPEPIGKFLCLGESHDGRIWAGRNLLVAYDGKQWSTFTPPPEVRLGIIETMFTTRERELWIGTRQFGAARFDGQAWHQVQGRDSLVANSVRSLTQTTDGSLWAATDRDISRFDGRTWAAGRLPARMILPLEGGALKGAPSGGLWINRFAPEWMRRAWSKSARVDTTTCEFWTVRHGYEGVPPETTILTRHQTIAQPGNLSAFWRGAAPWRSPEEARLEYSFRLDNQPWSAFSAEAGHAFFTLPAGSHTLEVRARDRDFNIDPTPAVLEFVVLPPVWRQHWFLALMALLLSAVLAQSVRVILERTRLRKANRDLAAEVEERRRIETALRASEADLKEAQQLADIGSWTLDLASNHIEWSDEVYRLLEFQPDRGSASYDAFLRAVHPDDRAAVDHSLRRSAREHTSSDFEHRLLFADGRIKYIHERCRTVRDDAHGRPLRILGTAQDITHRRELEEQVRQAQKMEAVGQLAGGVAHDFNNILAAVTMQAELASLADDVPAPVMEELQEIRAAVARATSLTRQLLLFSRRELMQPRELDLNVVVAHLSKMLQRLIGEHVHVEVRLHPSPLKVFADPGMLDQVLLNLAVNARDAMPDGGRVIIETGERTVPEDSVPPAPDARPGRFARMSVRDTGSGIPPEVLPRIFEPFFTTKEPGKGTGLGLATVFGIVRQHRGWIAVETATGKGTCFHVHLPPRGDESPVDGAAALPTADVVGGSETILLVEDDAPVRTTTRAFLGHHGYRVLEAASAANALTLWTRHHGSIDLLLTDLILPGGINGLRLARRLQLEQPSLKLVLVSGYATDASGGAIEVPPGAAYLQKPVKPEDLLITLRGCFAR